MKKIAIIPARGGSKRIPRKNIKEFLGRPILAYSIEAAIASKQFDEVMVSTDDTEIAQIAKQFGASVPFYRSDKNSNDVAGTAEVLIEVLEWYKNNKNIEFDYCCCIYCTAPFVTPDLLIQGMKTLINNGVSSVFPVVQYSYPPQRALHITNSGNIQLVDKTSYSKRSQDFEPIYHDCGQFYCLKTSKLLHEKKLFFDDSLPIIRSELETQDIDNISDWTIAELKYKLLKNMSN